MHNSARSKEKCGLGVGNRPARARLGGEGDLAVYRPGGGARRGERGQGVHMERQRRIRRTLAELAQPVGSHWSEKACIQRHGGEFQEHTVEGGGEVGRATDGDPGLAGGVKLEKNRGCAPFQILQDLAVRRPGVGMSDLTPQIPRAIGVPFPEKRAASFRGGFRRLEGLDRDAICGGSHETLVEGLALQNRLDEAHPLLPGVRRKA